MAKDLVLLTSVGVGLLSLCEEKTVRERGGVREIERERTQETCNLLQKL